MSAGSTTAYWLGGFDERRPGGSARRPFVGAQLLARRVKEALRAAWRRVSRGGDEQRSGSGRGVPQ